MLCLTIGAGLASRRYPDVLPIFVARYAGDVLWAAMVFWLIALVRSPLRTFSVAAISLTVSFAVELSQLYHAPWIESVRATRLGALVLGSGFLWSDLVCYSVGVCCAAGVDMLLLARAPHAGPAAPAT